MDRESQDGAPGHAQYPRSGLPRGSRRGDDAAPGPHRRCDPGRSAASAHARDAQRGRIRTFRRAHPRAFQFSGESRRMSEDDAVGVFANVVWLALLTRFVFIGSWEAIVHLFGISKVVLPAPSAIAVAFTDGLLSGDFVWHLAVTMYEILAGFFFGACSGLLLGFIVALVPLADRILYPYIVAFQTVPKVAIAPIIVIWFGYGVSSKIVITATIAFFPLLANSIMGLRTTPLDQIEMLVSCTASRWQVFTTIRLNQALPYIFVGLDVAILLSVIGAIVGQLVGSKSGLGWLILQRHCILHMSPSLP